MGVATAAQDRAAGHALHLFVSNQSLQMPLARLAVAIDGQEVLRRELATGTQHTWEEMTTSVATGTHTVSVDEAETQTHHSEEVDVERELWVVITFHGPPAQIRVQVFDQPVGLM